MIFEIFNVEAELTRLFQKKIQKRTLKIVKLGDMSRYKSHDLMLLAKARRRPQGQFFQETAQGWPPLLTGRLRGLSVVRCGHPGPQPRALGQLRQLHHRAVLSPLQPHEGRNVETLHATKTLLLRRLRFSR